jgi:hypothetical protein
MFRKFLVTLVALPLLTSGLSAASAASTPYTQNFDSMATYSGIDFDGNFTTLVSDQPAGEGFTSGKAIKMETQTKEWAGSKLEIPTSSSLISSANATGSVSVYSPDAENRCFVMKLEGPGVAIEKKLSVKQGWQTLNFNYANEYNSTKNYNVVALMPDFFGIGCNKAGTKPKTTWYVDNISFPGARNAAEVVVVENRSTPQVLVNFESNDTSGYSLIDFNGATSSIVTDAPADGSIGSTKAMKVVSVGQASGTTIVKKGSMASLISKSTFVAKANIWSPSSGKTIMLQIGSTVHESQIVEIRQTSVAGWKTYSFNFEVGGNTELDYPRASIFFDFLGSGGENPWYLDDLAFNGATGASLPGGSGGGGDNGGGGSGGGDTGAGDPTPTLLTYEVSDSVGALNTVEATDEKPQGLFGGATAVIADAPAGGLGGSALAITKSGAPWAGLNAIVSADGAIRITDADKTKVTFNYYSAKGNSPLAIQLWNGKTMGVEMIQSANQGWNNISFDLATAPAWSALVKYDKLVIFPDFQVDAANEVFYLDSLAVNGAVTPQITIVPVEPEPEIIQPSVKSAATISSKIPKVGVVLTSTKGTWNGTGEMTFKYTWYRCSVEGKTAAKAKPGAAMKCSAISGKASSSLKLTKSEKGKFIRVMVTATNSKGAAHNTSKTTAKKVA